MSTLQKPSVREPGNSRASLFAHNRGRFFISMVGVLFKVVFVLGFSTFTQKILDTISGEQVSSIPYLVVYAAVCLCFLLVSAWIEYSVWTAFRSRALTQYRGFTYNNILSKNMGAFHSEHSATYLSALSNDLNQIKDNYIEVLPYMVELILSFAGTIVLMVYYDVKLALIAVAISLFPILVSSFRVKQVEVCEEELSVANSRFVGVFAEIMQGFRTIKSMKAEKQLSARLLKENQEASHAFSNREHIEISVAYTASLSGHVAQIGFFFVSMIMARSDPRISVGVIVVFVQLMRNIIQLAITMPELIARVKAAKKLMEKNDKELETHRTVGENTLLSCRKAISVQEVSAGYGSSENVLRDISFELPAGSCCAIIGESGSGKTTLLNLLTGMNRDYSGSIRYDGTNIRNISGDSIFDLVSVIQQDVFIFDATIRENVTMFGPHDETALEDAIRKAGLSETVAEKGLDYRCGDNGNMLSGGEKQRIGLARSLFQGADVLLLDEATSALDAQTGYQIMETLQKMKDKTRLVVTHDIYPDLMENFDCILVLKDGTIAEQGTYGELMAKKGECYALVSKG